MITNNYKQNKSEVLDIYQQFVTTCKNVKVDIEPSIQPQVEKIQHEVFNLMVLGEAKSDKSTFINAYLGKDLLPMDVLQGTSAIIKIHHGEQFKFEAKTDVGESIVIEGDDNIRVFLKEQAAISDKYRDSIREMASSWSGIVTEIDITYPLSEAMQGITIIDSPSVGADGNVDKITEDYINDANAIIFVKSLSEPALESSSFMKFMQANCCEKHKASIFLVFTGKSNLHGLEFASLKQQAIEIYKREVEPQRIIFVDSKMQLLLNQCNELATEEKIDAYFDELDQKGNDYKPASTLWLKSKGSIQTFNEKMEEASNFGAVQSAIDTFCRVARYVQLVNLLKALEQECNRHKMLFSQKLSFEKANLEDPVALEARILEKKDQIDEMFFKMTKMINSICWDYFVSIERKGVISEEAAKVQADYEKRLDYFSKLKSYEITDDSFRFMKKTTMNAIDNIVQVRGNIVERLIKECDDKLIKLTDGASQIPVKAYVPSFTESEFDQIDKNAKKKACGEDINFISPSLGIPKLTCFMSPDFVTPQRTLDKESYLSLIVDNIRRRLNQQIMPQMVDNALACVDEIRELYMDKLKSHKNELESEYNKLLGLKGINEAFFDDIKPTEKKIRVLSELIDVISRLKDELGNYVGK